MNVSSPQERGCHKHPPSGFPESIEDLLGNQQREWDILVSALQLRHDPPCSYKDYIEQCIQIEYDVKVALIERHQNRHSIETSEILSVQTYLRDKNVPLLLVDCALDPNKEANKIRMSFYPNFL